MPTLGTDTREPGSDRRSPGPTNLPIVTLRGCKRNQYLARYLATEALQRRVTYPGMAAKTQIEPAGRPGRRPSLNADHTAVLRAITQEQPRSALDEVTRELLRRTAVKVNPVTVRKALREAGIDRLKPLRRAGERAAVVAQDVPALAGHLHVFQAMGCGRCVRGHA